jgi:hypothetical protein
MYAEHAPAPSPARSCALCGRDLWDVDRYIQAAAADVCDMCIHSAARAIELASGSERAVPMPPRAFGDPPPEPDELVEIQRAFSEGFAGDVHRVEDGAALQQVGNDVAARHPGMSATYVVERVRLAGPDLADVRFTVLVQPIGLRLQLEGRAKRIDGVWTVARETFLQVMARGGGTVGGK